MVRKGACPAALVGSVQVAEERGHAPSALVGSVQVAEERGHAPFPTTS